jgi:hypothetical protein
MINGLGNWSTTAKWLVGLVFPVAVLIVIWGFRLDSDVHAIETGITELADKFERSNERDDALARSLSLHETLYAHPVMWERANNIEQALARIEAQNQLILRELRSANR